MKKVCLTLIISFLLVSCSKDPMDRTIFIPDEDDSNLPAYTEWGYNSFGAEYDREYFLASNKIVPCKITYKNNELQFLLSGTIKNDRTKMSLLFTFQSPEILDFKELTQLHDYKIDLADSNASVTIMQDGKTDMTVDVTEGSLYFKRVQLLSIDDKANRVILSGLFDIRFIQSGFPVSISNGRFDVGITKDIFLAN